VNRGVVEINVFTDKGAGAILEIIEKEEIDILINNAWDVNDNFSSLFYTSVLLGACKCSIVININSSAAVVNDKSDYAIAKRNLAQTSSGFKDVYIKNGKRVIDIFPGAMKTDMTKGRPGYHNFINPRAVGAALGNGGHCCLYIGNQTKATVRYNKFSGADVGELIVKATLQTANALDASQCIVSHNIIDDGRMIIKGISNLKVSLIIT